MTSLEFYIFCMEVIESKASLDLFAKVATFGIFLLFVFIGQESLRALVGSKQPIGFVILHVSVISLLLIIVGVGIFYSPKKFSITNDSLVIDRVGGDKTFSLADIEEVHKLNRSDISGLIRTWGVGGLFGYFGKFYSPQFGTLNFYTTRRNNLILLILKDGCKVVISPDNVEFYDALKRSEAASEHRLL